VFWVFLACVAFRFLGLFPFVIDDDEAWWSVSARWLHKPWDFYHSVPDDKTPGSVWFDWVVGHLVPHLGPDPRLVRAAYFLLTVGAAWILGKIAELMLRSSDERSLSSRHLLWLTASLFLIATVLPSPKLLAYTSDGLMVLFVIAAYGLALFYSAPWAMLAAGALLGSALLVKQTAVFAVIPLLFARWPKKWSLRQLSWIFSGTLLVLGPCLYLLGTSELYFWVWTYPMKILTSVRGEAFSAQSEFLSALGLIFITLLPFLLAAWRFGRSSSVRRLLDFRVLWFFSSILVVVIGKGLFLHYFLMAIPPLVLLSVHVFATEKIKLWEKAWLGLGYALSCMLVTVPALSVTWGTDTSYYSKLEEAIRPAIGPNDSVLVWSGSPVLLAYLRSRPVTRFIIPRFAVAPYGTPETNRIFYAELSQDVPDVIIDLHERGDNRFANPIESEPELASLIQAYHLYVPQGIPWAKLYFRVPPPSSSGLVEIQSLQMKIQAYRPFPSQSPAWKEFESAVRTPPQLSVLGELKSIDKDLRERHALELLSRQAGDPDVRLQARVLLGELNAEPEFGGPMLSKSVSELLNKAQARKTLLPLISKEWWFTVSLAQLQPRIEPTPVVPVETPVRRPQSVDTSTRP
jgi:4-amino-4-deoxy-L-arabinose transferase-like glycosyltransferase